MSHALSVRRTHKGRPRKQGDPPIVSPAMTSTTDQLHPVSQWKAEIPDFPWELPQQHFHNWPDPVFDEHYSSHQQADQQSLYLDAHNLHSYAPSSHPAHPFPFHFHPASNAAPIEATLPQMPNLNLAHAHEMDAMTGANTFRPHFDLTTSTPSSSSSSSSSSSLGPVRLDFSPNSQALAQLEPTIEEEKREKSLRRDILGLHKTQGPFPRFALHKSSDALRNDPILPTWDVYRAQLQNGEISQDQLPDRLQPRRGDFKYPRQS